MNEKQTIERCRQSYFDRMVEDITTEDEKVETAEEDDDFWFDAIVKRVDEKNKAVAK